MTPRLIAFSGFIGAGKTTAASMLSNYGYRPTKFAKPLKAMMLACGLTMDDLEDPVKKQTPHPLLQGKTPR
jgi:dephospho-CoA kinase